MATEIEKELFGKYGVSKVQRCSLDSDNCPFCFSHKCSECDVDDIMIYTPITADKVLRLEEIILNKYGNIQLNKAQDDYPYQYETKDLFTDWHKTKVEAISSLLFGVYDELTPQERNEIKTIIEEG